MLTPMSQLREWVEFAQCRCSTAIKIKIEWNNRFTRRAGDAEYTKLHGVHYGEIRLSVPLWPRMSEEKRRETVIHETCHIICSCLFPQPPKHKRKGKNRDSHGRNWQALMRKCGIEPKRTHSIDRTGLKRKRKPQPKHILVCDCREHLVGPIRYKRFKTGQYRSFRCKRCKTQLREPKDLRAAMDAE